MRSSSPGHVYPGEVAVIGVPSCAGSAWEGVGNGPFFLRTLSNHLTWGPKNPGLLSLADSELVDLHRLVDLGDIDTRGLDAIGVADTLSAWVAQLPSNVIPAIMGGDHSLTLGSVIALSARYPSMRVVQLDHHLDVQLWGDGSLDPLFNTNVMSHVASVVGDGRCVQIGVGQFTAVERSHVQQATAELRRVGVQMPLTGAIPGAQLSAAVGSSNPVYISVDVDVIGSSEMSSTSYPAVAGLTTRELLTLLDAILEDNVLVGFDVVEFAAPRDDRDHKTLADGARAALVFMHLLTHALRTRPENND